MTREEAIREIRRRFDYSEIGVVDEILAALSVPEVPAPLRPKSAVERLHNLVDGLSLCDECDQDACVGDGPVTLCAACSDRLRGPAPLRVGDRVRVASRSPLMEGVIRQIVSAAFVTWAATGDRTWERLSDLTRIEPDRGIPTIDKITKEER